MKLTWSKINKFILILTGAFLFSCNNKNEWKAFTSKDGGFSVLFPGKPTDTTFLGGVALQHETFMFSDNEEANSYYKVNYINLPELLNPVTGNKMDACEFAKSYGKIDMQNYAMQLEGSLRELSTNVMMDGKEAEEFKVDFKDKSCVVTVRKFCANAKLYIVMVITRSNAENNDEVARFFNSFKLAGK